MLSWAGDYSLRALAGMVLLSLAITLEACWAMIRTCSAWNKCLSERIAESRRRFGQVCD